MWSKNYQPLLGRTLLIVSTPGVGWGWYSGAKGRGGGYWTEGEGGIQPPWSRTLSTPSGTNTSYCKYLRSVGVEGALRGGGAGYWREGERGTLLIVSIPVWVL